MNKKVARLRRARQTRLKIAELRVNRLTIYRSNLHIYASIIDASGSKVLVTASSNDTATRAELKAAEGNGGNVDAAKLVGKLVAERALKAGISSVAFDRAGYRYHGRVKALAEAAREAGLQF